MAKQKTLTVLRRTASIIGWFIVGACVVHLFLRGQSLSFYAASAVGLGFLWVGYELKVLAFHRKNTPKRWYQIGFLGIATSLFVVIQGLLGLGSATRAVASKVSETSSYADKDRDNTTSQFQHDPTYDQKYTDYMTGASPWTPD